MSHYVKCPECGKTFDRDKIDCIGPIRKRYFHKECYNNAIDVNYQVSIPTEEWTMKRFYDKCADYVHRVLKGEWNFMMAKAQVENWGVKYPELNMRPKGMYLTFRYYYDKYGKDAWLKGNGGIGIIPLYYKEAQEYWQKIANEAPSNIKIMNEQIKEFSKPSTGEIKFKPAPKKKTITLDFSDLIREEDLNG